MRSSRLHFILGFAVAVGGVTAACGSDDSPSTFGDGTKDAGGNPLGDATVGNGDGGLTIMGNDSGPKVVIPVDQIQSLQFTPSTWTVTSDGTTPQTKQFQLSVTLKNGGGTVNLAPDSLIFNRPDIGTFTTGSPATVTVNGGTAGTGTLQATYEGLTATATVNVNVAVSTVNGTLPAGAQAALDAINSAESTPGTPGTPGADGGVADGGDGGGTPGTPGVDAGVPTVTDPTLKSILYPYDKTVFPLGIDSPLLMWTGVTATDTYKLHITEAGYTYDYYTTAPVKAQVQFPQAVWDKLTTSKTGDQVTMTLARYDGTHAYISATEQWTIAHDSLRGAIYYWAISGNSGQNGDGAAHLARIQPGLGAQPQYIAGGTCIGCHAVSSDGTTLVGSKEGGDTSLSPAGPNQSHGTGASAYGDIYDQRAWQTYDVSGTTLPSGPKYTSKYFGGNLAVNNDGQYVVFGDQELHIAKTSDGTLVTTSGLEALSYAPGSGPNFTGSSAWMDPAFSPNGTKLAVVQGLGYNEDAYYPGPPCTTTYSGAPYSCPFYLDSYYENLSGGGIKIVDFTESSATFGAVRAGVTQATIAAATASMPYLSYPTFAPDNNTLAFQAGDAPDGCHYVVDAQHEDCGPSTIEKGNVWLTKDNTTTATRLVNLSDPPGTSNPGVTFEPNFNPVERAGYYWVVVSSSRAWGNQLAGGNTNANKKLWVAAISPDGTGDVSHPAFYLQSQEQTYENSTAQGAPGSINMRAFWTLSACVASVPPGSDAAAGGACTAGFECCSGFCENNVCVDAGAVSCSAIGQSCTDVSQCCSQGAVTCVAGVCQQSVVR